MKSNSKVALGEMAIPWPDGERATVRLPGLRLWVIIGIPPGFHGIHANRRQNEVRAVVPCEGSRMAKSVSVRYWSHSIVSVR